MQAKGAAPVARYDGMGQTCPVADQETGPKRVGRAVVARREELGDGPEVMTQEDLAGEAGVSVTMIRNLERGDLQGKPRKWPSVARALGWAPTSWESIANGGEPIPAARVRIHHAELRVAEEQTGGLHLPDVVRAELQSSLMRGYRIINLTDESGHEQRILLAWLADTPLPASREEMRAEIGRWLAVEQAAEEAARREDDDPPAAEDA